MRCPWTIIPNSILDKDLIVPDSPTVLLVDDEKEYLELLVKRLTRRGLTVHTAYSGKEAIEMVAAIAPDVVVMDVKMPGMSGLETLVLLKEQDQLLEVIMLTGHASLEDCEQGMDLCAFDYLMKPVVFDELLLKIEDAYTKRMLAQKNSHSTS